MTDDPAMLRLLAATEAAGAKLVIIGDHRQLDAVGPGGSLEALVHRHSGGVHMLSENVRQADPQERAVLGQLRSGSVERAVNWYAQHDRIATASSREQALDQMVAAFAKDLAEGKQTAMLAWRKANVAALNIRARAAMIDAGRLSGPELHVAGSTYQAGDRIVTLAPSAHGQLVTSQRGVVTAVDPETGSLVACMDDSRAHTLGPAQTGPDQLAHGYATTVHRSQGATFDTVHLLADGGGRELGYVGMSRSRQEAQVHIVADNVDQAVEDLTCDWSRERRQTWAIDTGRPDNQPRHPLEVEADTQTPRSLRAALGRARLKAERAGLMAVAPNAQDTAIRHRVATLDRHIQLLDQHLEAWTYPPVDKSSMTQSEAPAPQRSAGLSI